MQRFLLVLLGNYMTPEIHLDTLVSCYDRVSQLESAVNVLEHALYISNFVVDFYLDLLIECRTQVFMLK